MTKYAQIISDSNPANLLTVRAGGGKMLLDPVNILNGDR